ncbi:FkbM family methyltransferase [Mucilaginibacter dorajii]|uniref:FkbM family methyltransferase n=1 Tax=Mucilaginibacter dorajii TaxID=692994 RepID=A0ABP7Q2L5_9SPHI|nr:FkbM family methyltransferase [Mucilaginibacter dorajii]MCS3732778.1 FkbM family methyltransferase [Mucilaginibacter dorajii]
MEKIKRTFGFILNHPLAKRHPIKAIIRLLIWQLQTGGNPSKLFVKQYLSGLRFFARKGLTGITGNIYTGLHEFNDMGFLLHFLRPEDIFLDVGANVGSYTLLASGICQAKSITIEASKNTAEITQKNINLNKLQDKVTLINAAAGATNGTLNFSKNQDTTNHIISNNELANTDVETVNVISVDSLTIIEKPALIKIDVEGFETEVLNGMVNTLKQPSLKAIIIELNGSGARYGFNEEKIHQNLLLNGFEPYQYDPFARALTILDSFGNYNTIYCRDTEFINQRINAAKTFDVLSETI